MLAKTKIEKKIKQSSKSCDRV